jgi:hypothetical protein
MIRESRSLWWRRETGWEAARALLGLVFRINGGNSFRNSCQYSLHMHPEYVKYVLNTYMTSSSVFDRTPAMADTQMWAERTLVRHSDTW